MTYKIQDKCSRASMMPAIKLYLLDTQKLCHITIYRMVHNFGSRELWWQIAANKHFSGQNIGRLVALHSKLARTKIIGG